MHVVKVAPDAEDVALAVMLADLIRANLEQKPERVKDFMRLKSLLHKYPSILAPP